MMVPGASEGGANPGPVRAGPAGAGWAPAMIVALRARLRQKAKPTARARRVSRMEVAMIQSCCIL